MIKIVDYGMGNLRSVQKAFERVGASAEICDRPEQIENADKLILPGVGAFRDAIAELKNRGMVEPVLEHIAADRPFLGICLGLQLLMDVSEEDGEWEGLGVISGRVVRFKDQPDRPDLKIPHMGWNSLERVQHAPIFKGVPDDAHFYFVHSYHVVPEDDAVVAARVEHGETVAAVVARGSMFATQFHPEKSQNAGLTLLSNFAAL